MALQHISFACASCDLRIETEVGAQGAEHRRAFWCTREGKLHTLNVAAPGFRATCPSCAKMLDLLADFPLDACPRCHVPTGAPKTPQGRKR